MKKIGLFVEATFIPSFEGATQRFITLARILNNSNNFNVYVFHCYRGLSEIEQIGHEKFTTYAFNPIDYYENLDLIDSIIKREKIEILIMSDYFTILKIGLPIKNNNAHVKILYEAHDVNFKYNETIGSKPKEVINIEYECEMAALLNAEVITTFSEFDKFEIEKCLINEDKSYNKEYIINVPFGTTNHKFEDDEWKFRGNKLVFLGNFYHTPNRIALESLTTIIRNTNVFLPSDFEIFIVGNCPVELQFKNIKALKYLGKVNQLNGIFKKVSLALSPIFTGSGIKVKMIDYFIAGIPVLCSSQSLRGIVPEKEKEKFLIEDEIENYIIQILGLLSSPEKLETISTMQKEVIKNHSIDNVLDSLTNVVRLLNRAPKKNVDLSRIRNRDIPTPYFHQHFIKRKKISSHIFDGILKIN